jgi:hypothetical protein
LRARQRVADHHRVRAAGRGTDRRGRQLRNDQHRAEQAGHRVSLENASFPASNAVDGNTGTRWSSVIEHVINSTGGATPSNTTPVNVTSYP